MSATLLAGTPPPRHAVGVDKLNYEIFSLLEIKFLFGATSGCLFSGPGTPAKAIFDGGRVRVLAIDGCGTGAEDALLAAAALARLEAGLREQAGTPTRASPNSWMSRRAPAREACSWRC